MIVATLLVFLSTRPEPNVNVYRRLEALSQGFNEWVGEFSEVGAVADMEQEQAQREQALRDFATDYDVRLMIIVFDRNYIYTDNFIYNDGYVFFDSSNTYQRSEPFQLIVDKNYYEPNFNRRITNLYGTFEDKADTRWYYAGTAINGVFTVRDLSAHNYAIILADNPRCGHCKARLQISARRWRCRSCNPGSSGWSWHSSSQRS